MAMNKKEQALMRKLRERAALQWSCDVKPDLLPPKNGSNEISQGWDFNAYTFEVYSAWSSSIHHSRGTYDERDRVSARQNPKPLFSSEGLALQAMRHALEKKYAAALATIDERIEKAQQNAEPKEETENAG